MVRPVDHKVISSPLVTEKKVTPIASAKPPGRITAGTGDTDGHEARTFVTTHDGRLGRRRRYNDWRLESVSLSGSALAPGRTNVMAANDDGKDDVFFWIGRSVITVVSTTR